MSGKQQSVEHDLFGNGTDAKAGQRNSSKELVEEDIFGAEGIEDEFSDLEVLPESDDESSRPKKTSSTEKVEETGQNEPVPYEFTLPRFKKRQHREEDEDENADYAEKHREELRNELAELEASTKDDTAKQNPVLEQRKSNSSAAKEFMDLIMQDVKGSTRTKRRRKNGSLDEATRMDEEAIALKHEMQKAALDDLDSFANGNPGFAKLFMLDKVVMAMNKVNMHDAYMDANIMEAIRAWLEPLPDRSLPSLDIQRAMFKILDELPISTDHLRESGIGRITLFYVKNKKVKPDVHRMADRLINKWSRPILGLSDDYRTRRLPTATVDPRTYSPSKSASRVGRSGVRSTTISAIRDTNSHDDDADSSFYGSPAASARARRPVNYLPTFTVMPAPDQSVQIAAAQSKAKDPLKRIKQKLTMMKRTTSAGAKR